MMNKRLNRIIKLIKEYHIDTQTELVQRLLDEGYNVTQSTISRDIRKLKLTKMIDENGKLRYVIPLSTVKDVDLELNDKYISVLKKAIIGMEKAGNILVFKSLPGTAMAVAAAIDSIKFSEVVGCIAGDDTIFCAIKSKNAVEKVMEEVQDFLEDK